MKNIFFLLLTTLLFVFVANQSFGFDSEADNDPVKFEHGIYCVCVDYVHELPTTEVQKEFVTVQPLDIRQNENFGIFFAQGTYRSRDNIESEKQSYKDIYKNGFATVTNFQYRE